MVSLVNFFPTADDFERILHPIKIVIKDKTHFIYTDKKRFFIIGIKDRNIRNFIFNRRFRRFFHIFFNWNFFLFFNWFFYSFGVNFHDSFFFRSLFNNKRGALLSLNQINCRLNSIDSRFFLRNRSRFIR